MQSFMNMQGKKLRAVHVNRAETTRISYTSNLSNTRECWLSFTQSSISFAAISEDFKSSSATYNSKIFPRKFRVYESKSREFHYQVSNSETFDYYATASRMNKAANISRY